MSLGSDRDIRAAIDRGDIRIDPYDDSAVQPASYEVRLDRHFLIFDGLDYWDVDPAVAQNRFRSHEADTIVLQPDSFVLASTQETVTLGPTVAARAEGKSSLGRLGLQIHTTAGFIDPGFSGHITLELSTTIPAPLRLYAGMKIGQLCFFSMSTPVDMPYGSAGAGSHYQGQPGPIASRSWERFDRKPIAGQ